LAPHLKTFGFYGKHDIMTVECFALALQLRATIPGCRRLEQFDAGRCPWAWLNNAPIATKLRFLRVLLPSVKMLPPLTRNETFEPCFLEASALYLTSFCIELEEGGAIFSSGVLEAAPALRTISIDTQYKVLVGAAVLQPITAALRHGALQNIEVFEMCHCVVGDWDSSDF